MPDGISFDLSEAFKGIDFASERITSAAARGMEKAMNELAEESDKLAPKLTGELRSSRKVTVTTSRGSVTGTVTYSAISTNKRGWAYNYALHLHEMRKIANPTTPGTGPKFLSRPLKAHKERLQQIIAEEIAKELR